MSNVQYQFIKMELTQFSPKWEMYSSENSAVGLETKFNFAFNKSEGVLKCTTILAFRQDNQDFLNSELQTFFKLKEESIKELTEENVIIIPKGLLCQFASLSYGSYRGIIYMKTINTDLSNMILPPMYIDEVIKEDIKISL